MATSQDQLNKLKRELRLVKDRYEDLSVELQSKENQLLQMEDERNRYRDELGNIRGTLMQTDRIINQRVEQTMFQEKDKMRQMEQRIIFLEGELQGRDNQIHALKEELERKDAEVEACEQKLREVVSGYDISDALRDIKEYRDEKLQAQRTIQELTQELNRLSDQMEDLLSENTYLRELAQVPDNYGVIQDIKLNAKQKNEDYLKLIRNLEEEREEREREIAELRQKNLRMTLLYNKVGSHERYRGLTIDQLNLVDQYVLNLKEGRDEPPLNDRSRELRAENERLKAQLEFLEGRHMQNLENLLKKFSAMPGNTLRSRFGEETVAQQRPEDYQFREQQNEELYAKLENIIENLTSKGQIEGGRGAHIQSATQVPSHTIQWPPAPLSGPYGNWSDVKEGYSYRFKTKLPVEMQDFFTEQGFDQNAARFEIASLQLHNLETMELMERKDREIQALNLEIEDFRNQMRQILLVQDELFKQYFDEKKKYEDKIKTLTLENNNYQDRNAEVEHKSRLLEDLVNTIKKSDETELKNTLAEYAKKISIQEVNLIRLARKYDCLKAEETHLRDSYHKIEAAHAEREGQLIQRLNDLISWKQKATSQLKVLFSLQVNSVPVEDYRLMRSQLEILQEKYSDLRIKESNLLSKVARLETNERDLFMKNELVRDLKEDIMEGELELEMVKKRLEDLDPTFKKYTMIFKQIVDVMKKKNISPAQVFEMIDKNKDGRLAKNEFEQALIAMQIPASRVDLDILFMFLDLDGSGVVEYQEFLKKLKRSGIKMRNNEEELVFKIYEAITKANLTLKQAFDIFDKDGDSLISKKDMTDTFSAMNFGIEQRIIEGFYSMADINGDGSINFDEFYRLFEGTLKEAFREEKKGQIDELNWKMQIMIKIDNAIKKNNISLLDAFKMIDKDGSGKITYDEFQTLFTGMKIELASPELHGLFNDIDKDKSGAITYFEFQHYFNEAKRENDRINRLKFIASKTENMREAGKSMHEADDFSVNSLVITDTHKLTMKISLLETREKNANNRVDMLNMKIKNLDSELKHYEKQIKDLESHNLKLQEEYYHTREREIRLEQKVQGVLPKEQADKIKKLNEKMSLDWADLQASRKTFRNLYEYSVSQVKILKLAVEKKKNETEVLQNTVKELQTGSDENALVGKLQHELMVSKWNEGVVNKKYESILDENRQIKIETEQVEVQLGEREDEIVSIHNAYGERLNQLEKSYAQAKLKVLPTVSVSKIEELGNKIREVAYQKTDLETYNKTLRQEIHDMGVKLDYLETQKKALEELEERLKKSNSDELSQQLIEVSTKLSEYRLAELKAKRDVNLLEQKEEYHQRLIRQQTERMKLLEEELAAWELKHAQREDFWRKRYTEQMGLIFGKVDEGDSKDGGTINFGLPKEPKKTALRKDVAYLNQVAAKNDELRDLKTKVEEYQKLLEDKNARITVLEEALNKIDQKSQNAALPRMDTTKSLIKEAYNEEEAKKFAHAAQKTIQTLHEIIEDKNKQIQRKEDMLKKLREESLAHKNLDAEEMNRLNRKIEEMNRGVAGTYQPVPTRSMVDSAMLGRVSAGEVEAVMLEKDRRMELLNKELEGHDREKKDIADKLRQYRIKCENLESELALEKEKNEAGKLQREIESLKKQVKIKDQELAGLKKSIEAVKNEYLKINGMTVEKEEEMKHKLKEKSNQQEMQMKLATQRIQELDSKIKKLEKEVKEFNQKESENREQMTLLKEENQKLKGQMLEKDSALKQEKQQREKLRLDLDTVKEEKTKVERSNSSQLQSEKEAYQNKIAQLERSNTALRAENSKDFFDDEGNLKEGDYLVFPDSGTLYKKIRDWMRMNPQDNLFKEFQAFDKNKTGSIRENDVYAALRSIGVKLKPRDQATLMKETVKKENNEVDYADLFKKIKGCHDFGQSFNSEKLQTKALSDNENKFGTLTKQKKEFGYLGEKDKGVSKNIEILKNEVANLKKENEKLEKQLQNWRDNYNKLDKEHKALLSKPITKSQEEGEGAKKINTLQKLDTVQDLRDKVYDLENKVTVLEKIINTEKEPLIHKLKLTKDKLEEEVKQLKAEALKSRAQVENFYSKKLTPEQLKEEMVYEKDMIITNLKDKLDALRTKEAALENKIFELEQRNLDLQLEKESHDLQAQRLHRRIQELDEFKNTYQELIKNADKAMTVGAKRRT